MSQVLYVGDPHARPEDLDDCDALIGLIEDIITSRRIHRIVFLGDQHHTHAIMHVEVLGFWRRALTRLRLAVPERQGLNIYLMLGNHDQPGDAASTSHALMAYADMPRVTVIDTPMAVDGILHVPYMHSADDFVATCRKYDNAKVLVCHQTFNGAKYENGFFAKDGVDPDKIPQTCVLSGHIHMPQSFGKVTYLGSPRWLTFSDANGDRFLNVVEHDDVTGEVLNIQQIPTAPRLRKIFHLIDTPEAPAVMPVDTMHRYYVDVRGPAEWCEQRRNVFSGRARVRTQRTDATVARVRESEGIATALKRFVASYRSQHGTETAVLERLVDARLAARPVQA
jgi:hypothetical protein